jgi:hypothetical protein
MPRRRLRDNDTDSEISGGYRPRPRHRSRLASNVLERAADPEKVCAQQLMPGVDDRWQVAGVAFPGHRGCLFPH